MAISLDLEHALGDPVAGVDEAGRGPLAGGVYAACVSAPLALAEKLLAGAWAGVNDSKRLTPKRRDALAEAIRTTPGCAWAVASATPAEIDRLNILRATHLAMRRAVEEVAAKLQNGVPTDGGRDALRRVRGGIGDAALPMHTGRGASPMRPQTTSDPPPPLAVLVDGLPVASLPNSTNVVKGDATSLFIAAASILAKTARDADCLRLERAYPGYGFARHKGYPTKEHLEALRRLGPCPEHRRSFGPVCQMQLDI